MEVIAIILLVVILVVLILLFLKKPNTSPVSQLLEIKEAEHQKAIDWLRDEKKKLEDEMNDLKSLFFEERNKRFQAEEQIRQLVNQQTEQAAHLDELHRKSKLEFELVANKILEDKSSKFTAMNKFNMDLILNPLKENIKAFEDKVEKVYKAESEERHTLKGAISQLLLQSKNIQEEANNLSRALKGDNKKQGNWGEVILERVLERSGLVKDQEYRTQAAYTGPDGLRLQPDVVLDLPDDKHLVIDAKVSLLAFEKLVSATNEAEKELYLKQHILSLKGHIQGLSAKNYQSLYQINSPDFVLLFLPIESSFALTVQNDAELFNYAWDRKVVLVSPSTLLATLRTIASVWKQERQNRNVLEIARLSGSMYDKFVGFLSDMESIGRNIRQSQDAYDKALNKLSTGAGNLTTTADKIKKLGAKTNKKIDSKFLDPALLTEDEL